MKRSNEHDANAGLADGRRRHKFRPPPPKNKLLFPVVAKRAGIALLVFVIVVPLIRMALGLNP